MNIRRRQFLALGGIGLLGTSCAAVANKIDGIGPNRGIAERTFRNKHTCVNSDVLESAISTRLSKPEDFGSSACKMIEDSFEGPYFTCTPSTGKDIATGQAGQPLTMALRLVDQDCKPIPNGVVDIWACNADGYYAGYSNDPNDMPPIVRAVLFGHVKPDTEDRFCRGALRTDADGIAEFNSVYPGLYYGQPIHVHFKAHVDGKNLLTTQANFPEDWNLKVMKLAPYNKPRTIERVSGFRFNASIQSMMRIKQGLFNGVLALSLAVISTGSTVLANEGSLILPSQADSNIEFALQDGPKEIDPAKLMQVFVGSKDACCDGKSPIAGRYSVTDNTLTFDPAFDFITDQRYTVSTRYRNGKNNAAPKLKEFTLRSASEAIKPEVLMVYPSGPTLPENTLRFYIHFSTPMKPHLAEKFIKLIDSEGNSDTTAFMKFKQELWSNDRRRLTLLMDLGRIKRGVAQNVAQGPALLEGNTYSIVVDGGWPSASGKQASPRFEKVFSVTSALRTLPDTKLWKVESPEISTVKLLVIKFDRPFDKQLAQSSISIFNEDGNVVSGTVIIDSNEKIWRFQPENEWKGDALQIAVDAKFEDVAGNNFKDLLDHSVDTDVKSINQIRFEVELNEASN